MLDQCSIVEVFDAFKSSIVEVFDAFNSSIVEVFDAFNSSYQTAQTKTVPGFWPKLTLKCCSCLRSLEVAVPLFVRNQTRFA